MRLLKNCSVLIDRGLKSFEESEFVRENREPISTRGVACRYPVSRAKDPDVDSQVRTEVRVMVDFDILTVLLSGRHKSIHEVSRANDSCRGSKEQRVCPRKDVAGQRLVYQQLQVLSTDPSLPLSSTSNANVAFWNPERNEEHQNIQKCLGVVNGFAGSKLPGLVFKDVAVGTLQFFVFRDQRATNTTKVQLVSWILTKSYKRPT